MISWFVKNPELYNNWRFSWNTSYSKETFFVLGILLFLAVLFTWKTSARLSSLRTRILLLSLRSVAAFLLLFLLAGPSIELRHIQKRKNYLPIFVDHSLSMQLQFSDQKTRLQKIKDFLQLNDTSFQQWSKDLHVEWFSVAKEIRPLNQNREQWKASGEVTHLLEIPRFLQNERSSKPLGGVIILSDMIDTSNEDSTSPSKKEGSFFQREFTNSMKALRVPVLFVTPPQQKTFKDVSVSDVLGDTFAFLHNTATLDAQLRVHGLADKQSIQVSLYQGTEHLKTEQVALKKDQTHYKVRFQIKPRKAGKHLYSIRVPHFKGEVTFENNQKTFLLKVIRDRIRVLQVTGRPSWDVRFLRRLFKKNASVDLISFFILRTHQSEQNVAQEDLSLIPFPSHELFTKSLKTFDLVIFQDFNYGPYNIRRYLPNIRKFVRNGGAFAMIGGDLSFGSGGYINTPIEQLLPVQLDVGGISEDDFQPRLTRSGKHHPITKLFSSQKKNQEAWKQLPTLPGMNLLGISKKKSITLLQHPTLKTDKGTPRPVLSIGSYHKGRVLAFASDGSWKWNLPHIGNGGSSTLYYRFWNNAIRWLIKDPKLERIQMTPLQSSISPDEEARFRVVVFDQEYKPVRKGKVRYSFVQGKQKKIVYQHSENLDSNAQATLSWKPSKAGFYKLQVEAILEKEKPITASEWVHVEGGQKEFNVLITPYSWVSTMAQQTKGKQIHFDDSISSFPWKPPLVLRIDRSKSVDFWHNQVFLFLLFLAFFIEWGLRRKKGLL